MAQPTWVDIDVPRGSFIGWGNTAGQFVAGTVLEYSPTGGSTAPPNNEPCPQLEIELSDPAASFNNQGERIDFPAGTLVMVTASQKNLQRGVKAANLVPGDMVKITLKDFEPSGKGNPTKIFGIAVARGAGKDKLNGRAQPALGIAEQSFGSASNFGGTQPVAAGFGEEPPF